jgi:hypothetical protein
VTAYLVLIRDRLGRANEHIEAIKTMLRAYYGSDPYNISGEFDPDAQQIHFNFHGGAVAPPIAISTRAGEALHNLRSSLDHLAWMLVEQDEGTPDENTSFPILRVAPTANKKGVSPPPHVSGGVSDVAAALMDRAQPYQLGEDYAAHPLWILRELSNLDKHRHITIRGARFTGGMITGQPPRFTFQVRTGAVSEWGAEVKYVPDDPSVDVDCRTTLQVMVHEINPAIDMPLLDALGDAREVVEAVIREAEETCF